MGAIKDMVDRKDFKAALSEVKKIDVENSMNPQFMVLCGRVYAENKKFDEARKTLISAHILAPKSEQVLDEIIRLYLKIGYFTKAKQYFQIFSEIVSLESIEGQKVTYNVKKALQAPDDELIKILQSILSKEYIDEYAFELALLYRKAGMNEDSVKECDKIRDSFAQSNLYVKWAKPLKMGSINVNKAFNCYPKDEVAEQSGNIYQYVQKENEQLKKDYLELVGSAGGSSTETEPEDDSIVIDSLDDDDAISVDAEVTETATVVGGSSKKHEFVHPPDEEIEVEIIEEGSEETTEGDTLMIEDESAAAKEKESNGEDIKAALDRIAKSERLQEEAAKLKEAEETEQEEPAGEEVVEEVVEEVSESAKEVQKEVKEQEAEIIEEEIQDVVDDTVEVINQEADSEGESQDASESGTEEEYYDDSEYEEEAFDMADENKPKLSLKLAGGGGGGGRRGGGSNRSSFGGGGMRGGMGGQIISKEEREFMANYDDSKERQREAEAKERARQAKQAMEAEKQKAEAAAKRAEMEREQAEARAKAEAEKKAAEAAARAEQEAELAKQRAEAEAKARAEAEAEAGRRAEAEAKARAESDARAAEERKAQEERDRALEEERARKALEEREAAKKAEEAAKAEAEAKLEAERKAEEERAAKALAEQERLRNSVSRARSKADQEREDAIAAIRAKVEAERAAKEEKKRKAQEQLDDQERRRIKKMPAFKRKSLSKEVLDRLGLAIDDKGELIDPPPKTEEAKAAEAEQKPAEPLGTAEPKAPEGGVNPAEPDENRPDEVDVKAGRAPEETDDVEVNAGREAEPTENIEVNAGREAEATDNIEINGNREPEAEGVKVQDDGVTLGNVGLAGGSLSSAGLEGGSLNRDGHSEVTLANAAFAGDKLVTDATFEEEQKAKEEANKAAEEEAKLKAEEEAKKAEEEAKAAEEAKKAEEEAKAAEEAKKAEEEAKAAEEAKKAEEEAKRAEEEAKLAAEEEIEEEAEVEVVEAEAVSDDESGEVIELGAEPEPVSDVVEVSEEAQEEKVEEEVGEPKVIDGIEIDAYGVPVDARKHIGKYAASVEFRRQFRTTLENIVEKKGIYRNLVVLTGEGDKSSNVAIDFARAYHDIGLCKTKVVATIKASVLNKTDLNKIVPKLKGGCLVIEKAGDISEEKAAKVYDVVNNPDNDVVLMLVGEAESVNDMFKESPDLNSLFHSLLLLHDLSDKDLADISVEFMAENGYKPDDEAYKVLLDKIASMDSKGVDDVLKFVADALNKAEQRSKDTLGDVVFNGDLEDGDLNTVKGMDFE